MIRLLPWRLIAAWVALSALLAITTVGAYLPMGPGINGAFALAIAIVKAAIVAAVFMRIAHGPAVLRIAAAAGVLWLLVLLGLSGSDYATRAEFPPPTATGE